jgi:hypothetical protein
MGLMRAGDANDDDLTSILDFGIIRSSMGRGAGDPGYDERADFDGNGLINIVDHNLFKNNFGQLGWPRLGPLDMKG